MAKRTKKQTKVGASEKKSKIEGRQADALDQLAEFEDFQTDILPMLRQDMKSGMSAEAMRAKYMAMVQARQLSIALASTNENVVSKVSNEILDRAEGKATQKVETKHILENAEEEQIDALIKQKAKELGMTEEQVKAMLDDNQVH